METIDKTKKKKEKREENIANGRSSFEQELKHAGLSMKDVTDPENLPLLLKKVTYGSLEEMYAAIGYGGFIQKKDAELLHTTTARHEEELAAAIAADQTGDGFICDMFRYELDNHEYSYTMDPSDTLDALGYTAEEINADQRLLHGLEKACKAILQSA